MKKYSKIITAVLAVIMLISSGTVAFAYNEKTDAYRDYTGATLIASRKGCFDNAPENSLKAIHAAESAGADIIEIDVRSTSDGVLILMEDDTVERTCYGYGEKTVVSEMTYEEISKLRLLTGQGGFNAEKTQETVPTLEDVFNDRKISYLASSQYPDEQRALFLIDADWSLRDRIYELGEKCGVLSDVILYVDDAKTEEIAEWKSSVETEPMIMTYFKGNIIFVATANVKNDSAVSNSVHLATKNPYGVIFGKTVQNKAFASGIRTMAAPCSPEICGKIMQDTEAWWDYLISCGFSIIMTDHVAELKKYISDCEEEKAKLLDIYNKTVTEWKLPDFRSDNFHDYKLAYTNAVSDVNAIFAQSSNAKSDIQKVAYDLQKAYDDINEHYGEFEDGTAGMTVTPLRILLCALTVAVVVCAEIYVYKKKKKS